MKTKKPLTIRTELDKVLRDATDRFAQSSNFLSEHTEKSIISLLEIISESNNRIANLLDSFKKNTIETKSVIDINKSARLIVGASNTLKQTISFSKKIHKTMQINLK